MLQFWKISTNAAPLCAAARRSTSVRPGLSVSIARATNVASAPSATDSGLKGKSTLPIGGAAVDRVHAVGLHVVREARRAADARDEHHVLALDAELRHEALHRRQDRVVAATRAPADLLVGLEVFCGQLQLRGHSGSLRGRV